MKYPYLKKKTTSNQNKIKNDQINHAILNDHLIVIHLANSDGEYFII